ncbi:hypothetical protein ACSSS7_006905 [Eimeria intestinalis]
MENQSQTAAIAAAAAALGSADTPAARRQLALLYQKLAVDEKRYVLEADRDEIFRRLRKDNRMCFDCSSRNPTWISLTHAIYVCLTCSGKHRRLGTHLSFVRRQSSGPRLPQRTRRLVNSELQGIGWIVGTQQQDSSNPQQQQQQQQPQQQQQQQHQPPPRMQEPQQHQHQQGFATAPAAAVPAVSPQVPATAQPVVTAAAVGAPPFRAGASEPSWGAPLVSSGTGRGVRSRKLEMDFDFEKEAALLAAKQRAAAAQGASQGGPGVPSQTAAAQQQHFGGRGSSSSNSSNSNSNSSSSAMGLGPKPVSTPSFGSSNTTATGSSSLPGAAGSGYGASSQAAPAASYGSNSQRFSGAKSISSAQFFDQEESSSSSRSRGVYQPLSISVIMAAVCLRSLPPVAALPVDPSRRAIGSDEVFGRSSSGRRGWEDQSAARVEALRMHAQQGWQQLSQVGSDALSKAREWLAGT